MSETSIISKAEATLTASEPGGANRKRILLVEGDGFTRLVLLLLLRLVGFAVDFTSNGILGLRKLRSCNPDILLVDLKLNGLSGLDLIKAARSEPAFGNRPIYVFTHTNRMNRATRKELPSLNVKVFDKNVVTREDLVQTFSANFLGIKPSPGSQPIKEPAELLATALKETVVPEAIEEIIAGVREQSEMLAQRKENSARAAGAEELHGRVSSLVSCADAAGLLDLARNAKALENLLLQLCRKRQPCGDKALHEITQSIEVMGRMSFTNTDKKDKPLTVFPAVIVDETPESNRAIKEALLKAGFDPLCFEEPGRARDYLASNRTKLLIANVVLPEAHRLSLEEIRKLSLHAETRIIFAPESTRVSALNEELPTSAPRLDSDSLLLAELVVKALNEVQSTRPPLQPSSEQASTSAQISRKSPARTAAAASLPIEDGFDLFAPPQKTNQTSAPAQSVPHSITWASQNLDGSPTGHQNPIRFSATPSPASRQPEVLPFDPANLPSEPIFRAQPDSMDTDHELQPLAPVPESEIEGSQVEEHPIESLPPSDFLAEAPPAVQPEPTTEDHVLPNEWLAPAEGQAGEPFSTENAPTALQPNEAAAAQELPAAEQDHGNVMNNQWQTTPAEWSPQGEDGQLADNQEAYPVAAVAPAEQGLAEARCAELEQELASLRQILENFQSGFGQHQQTASEADQRVQELEERLNQSAAELQKHREEQAHSEADWRQQLLAANEAGDAGRIQTEDRCSQLQQEISSLRQAREDLANKLSQEQKFNAESLEKLKQVEGQLAEVHASDPETRLRQEVAALARATAELAKERGQRQRSDQRAAELNTRMQALHADLSRTLQAQRDDLARISTLEEEHRQLNQSLEQRSADLEQLQDERQVVEDQLQKAKELNVQLHKDVTFFEEANKKSDAALQELQNRLEASLNAARENEARHQQESAERQRLAQDLENAQHGLQTETRRRELLEQELQGIRSELQEREAKLQKAMAERQQLSDALDSIQRLGHDGSERDLELSKLQSALQSEQVERQRQDNQLVRIRRTAKDAANSARAMRTGLRRQIRESVENMVNSTRHLLELEMGEAQKKIAESVLQDVLLVQTRLRDPEPANADSTPAFENIPDQPS